MHPMRLEFLLWDPGAEKQLALSAAEMPFNIGDLDSNFMVQALDSFMAAAYEYTRCLCCDAHGSHQAIRRIMFGVMEERDHEVLFLGDVPNWCKLSIFSVP